MFTTPANGSPDVSAVFLGNGTARLSVNGETTSLRAGSETELRSEVVARAHEVAQKSNSTIRVRVMEAGNTTLVDVEPDGSNTIHTSDAPTAARTESPVNDVDNDDVAHEPARG